MKLSETLEDDSNKIKLADAKLLAMHLHDKLAEHYSGIIDSVELVITSEGALTKRFRFYLEGPLCDFLLDMLYDGAKVNMGDPELMFTVGTKRHADFLHHMIRSFSKRRTVIDDEATDIVISFLDKTIGYYTTTNSYSSNQSIVRDMTTMNLLVFDKIIKEIGKKYADTFLFRLKKINLAASDLVSYIQVHHVGLNSWCMIKLTYENGKHEFKVEDEVVNTEEQLIAELKKQFKV